MCPVRQGTYDFIKTRTISGRATLQILNDLHSIEQFRAPFAQIFYFLRPVCLTQQYSAANARYEHSGCQFVRLSTT